MNTYLISLVQSSGPTPIGVMVVDWIKSPPIYATVNSLRKVHYMWADGRGEIGEKAMQRLRRHYPLTVYWNDARTGRGRCLRPNP